MQPVDEFRIISFQIRAEEQQKAARSSQCSHGGSYDHREVAAMLHAMQLNGCASPIDGGMRPMPQQMRTGSSTSFSTNGGRFTGDYVASRGAANGRPIYEGARGGQFHITPSGNKSYLPK